MLYFKKSVYNLSKGIFPSNNMIIEDYTTDLNINKDRTKKRSFITSVTFKQFTILFLTLLYFLFVNLCNHGKFSISVIKLNNDHLRILAEKNVDLTITEERIDKKRQKYNETFQRKKKSLIKSVFDEWETFCIDTSIRYSLDGRKWEEEKFMFLYNTITKDIVDYHNKVVEEYQKFKESSPNDKEYSAFFKKKTKDLYKFIMEERLSISKYITQCREEKCPSRKVFRLI